MLNRSGGEPCIDQSIQSVVGRYVGQLMIALLFVWFCVHLHTHTHTHTYTFAYTRALCAQYIFDCSQVSSLPNVGFIIGGNTFELTGSEYVIKVSSTNSAFGSSQQ